MRPSCGVVAALLPAAAVVAVLVWLPGWGRALGIAGGWLVRAFTAGRLTFAVRTYLQDGLHRDIEYGYPSDIGRRLRMHSLGRRAREHAEAGEGEEAVGFFERLVDLRRKQAAGGHKKGAHLLGSALHNCGATRLLQRVGPSALARTELEEAVSVRRTLPGRAHSTARACCT
ncbi:hypothetical protein [Nonomuraea sp. SBT364]|uniref:hypothetical protein n=1 Tax=Nonomuraea sp. SBT364 TaxID=1580530 RepID=UPI00066B2A4D|nr:hypothetical protein [Nonomuraea sp. SBT364]